MNRLRAAVEKLFVYPQTKTIVIFETKEVFTQAALLPDLNIPDPMVRELRLPLRMKLLSPLQL